MIKGYASLKGTEDYFQKRKIAINNTKETPWFYTLPIAMGNHLGDFSNEDTEDYIKTMTYGIENGINFIDTAINYRGMRSEKDVGTVLNHVLNVKKSISREEIIISTKCGGIFGDYTEGIWPINYIENILIPQGIIKRDELNIVENERHTLVPKFHERAMEISRENLHLETIDIQYIHNPEVDRYVLGEEKFYGAIKKLFYLYEEQVKKGYIRFYGMATWDAFLVDEDSPWYISMEKVHEIAHSVGGGSNHFKFIQMPYNIYRKDAALKQNQPVNGVFLTPLQAAKKLGFTVTISSPLNEGNFDNKHSANKLLAYVTDTEEVLAAMVGCKNITHLISNLNLYKY